MKLRILKGFLSAVVLTVALSGLAHAQSGTVVFTDDGSGTSTGALLQGLGTGLVGGEVATEIPGLNISVVAASQPSVTSVGTRFGVGDNFFRESTSDSITFSFDQAVEITEVSFSSVSGTEMFSFAGANFGETANGVTIAPISVSLAADQPFTVAAVAGNTGFQNIDVTVTGAAIPEPSSAALLGLLGLVGVARRRRR